MFFLFLVSIILGDKVLWGSGGMWFMWLIILMSVFCMFVFKLNFRLIYVLFWFVYVFIDLRLGIFCSIFFWGLMIFDLIFWGDVVCYEVWILIFGFLMLGNSCIGKLNRLYSFKNISSVIFIFILVVFFIVCLVMFIIWYLCFLLFGLL